ncbi:MAG: M56 family metallopeptidase, partial [Acidobacteriaceae bacterium]|nr:M56 family metallopeptidase [Acidobacteriaceae bacterium]
MPNWISYSLLLEIALKSTAVLGAASLTVLLSRAKSAAVRHLVWSAAFAALLALPLLSISLPTLRMPVANSLLAPGLILQTNSSSSRQTPASSTGRQGTTVPPLRPDPQHNWPKWLILAWMAGTAISLAQMSIGWAAIRRLQRRANLVTIPELASLTKLLGIREKVSLFQAPRGSMPITFGLLRAVIFLPAEILEWSAERRRLVLLHELAHVRRGDSGTHVLARAALSLYWWNPLAWTAWRGFLKERERAADDLVLSAGGCASEYASHLLEIARSMQLSPAV